MITSSYRGIVRAKNTVSVQSFVPPQTSLQPLRSDVVFGQEQAISKKKRQGISEGKWVSHDPEEEEYLQASQIRKDASEEAEEILRKANEEAEQILKEAREEAELLKQRASGEGFAQGFREGKEEAEKESIKVINAAMDDFRQDMERALGSVEEAKEKCIRQYLEELKECSIAVAEKVIHISLKSSGEIIKRMILSETERLKKVAWVKIYMEKTDYEMMVKADADVIGELSRLSDNIKFIIMEKEQSGNCIIEMPEEIIDIGVGTQMENVKEILGSIRM